MTMHRVIQLKECDRVWINVNLATFDPALSDPYGSIHRCALGIHNGKIARIESMASVTATRLPFDVTDGHNGWLTPGLIDCHTHLIFGGHRAQEFELRLKGVPYEQIAAQGGGILATARATRVRSKEQLIKSALPRLKALTAEGVTLVEIKSGYGLNLVDEIKMLEVARELNNRHTVKVINTLLVASALPPEFAGRTDEYVDMICQKLIPEVAEKKLAAAVDIHCENAAFTMAHRARIFQSAIDHGLPTKCHTEQFSESGGASLAAHMNALSCDHLQHITEQSIADMAESGSIAVLLPGSYYFMRCQTPPPVERLRQYQIPIALATDTNPGTSPLASIRLMMNMGCIFFQLTPAEALAGVTINAARALGVSDQYGSLEEGKAADFCLWDIDHPNELAYQLGHCPLQQRIIDGQIVDTNQ
ncbi:imidazolonepropionase [Endozoicomonas arenosclerae]|uniref:imidazolonepropionase n=1 Tax=Endozoicomonas arenosclerae TaxID=1633495 RepID=UPI000A7EC2A3|nr:imidazolonepropionase [Endozoicomonas arenosclerae]